MIWADRVGLVLMVPVALVAMLQASSGGGAPSATALALFVAFIWLVLRSLDFIFVGRRR